MILSRITNYLFWFKMSGYVDFVNYVVARVLPQDMGYQCKKKFFFDLKHYYWDEPLIFKRGTKGVFQRCIPEEDIESVMTYCHASAYGGLASTDKTMLKILQAGLYWTNLFKDAHAFIKKCDQCYLT